MQQRTRNSLVMVIFGAALLAACSDSSTLPPCDTFTSECGGDGGSGGDTGGTAGFVGGGVGGTFPSMGGQAGLPGTGGGFSSCASNDQCGGATYCELPGNSCGNVAFLVIAPQPQMSGGSPGSSGDVAPPGTGGAPDLIAPPRPGSGFCAELPQVCAAIFAPVCGCDGKTYGNDCQRRAAGVSKQSEGACDKPILTVGEGNACGAFEGKGTFSCSKGLFCEQDTKVCSMPGAKGICRAVPQQCVAISAPVCGCDGKTYQNDCVRRQAGQSLANMGTCGPTAGGLGEACGPALGINCDKGLVCDPQANQCPISKFVGTCRSQAAGACSKELVPVCGCDGRSYANDCLRLSAGITKNHDGECKLPVRLISSGIWGGDHVELAVKEPKAGGFLKFDCGSAEIVSPLEVDSNGNFMWKALYMSGGGAAMLAPVNTSRAAIVTGATDGKSMKFSVQIVGSTVQPSFGLQLGTNGNFTICF